MSRYSFVIFVVLAWSVLGCSTKQTLSLPSSKVLSSSLVENLPDEDSMIIIAMDAQNHGDYKTATAYFKKLYDETEKLHYATQAVKSAVVIKDYETIKSILDKAQENDQHDATLDSFLVAYYIDKKDFDKAKELTTKLIKEDRTSKNLELLGLTYEGLGEYDKALRYFKESYAKDTSPFSLLKLTDILYLKKDRKDEAIRMLESDATLHGCSETLCARLLQFYAFAHDDRGITRTLKKMYKKTKNPIYAKKLIEFYSSKKNFSEAITFLKESEFDDMVLLDIYTSKKDYKSAMALAEKLYKKDNNPTLLAKSAILEYESSKNKNDKKMLKNIQDKFEKVIDILKDSMYYNYYGYILIEHDIDLDKGIKLVKKALKEEPDSAYYVDSLAWGLYKKGECSEASVLMDKISKEDSDQEEIKEHKKLIKNCTKAQK